MPLSTTRSSSLARRLCIRAAPAPVSIFAAVFLAAFLVVALLPTQAQADPFRVDASTLNVRNAPRSGAVVDKLKQDELVEVYKMEDGWARLSAEGEKPRWVSANYLRRAEDPEAPSARDARIATAAIPEPGQYGLTEADVDLLWRGASQLLDSGKCMKIDYAAKSLTQENTYFFNCGEESFFLTPDQLRN